MPKGKLSKKFETTEDKPLRIPANALKESADEQIVSVTRDSEVNPSTSQGTSQVPPIGKVSQVALDNANGVVLYTPTLQVQWPLAPSDSYQDTFLYKVKKGNGQIEERRVTLTVRRPDRPTGAVPPLTAPTGDTSDLATPTPPASGSAAPAPPSNALPPAAPDLGPAPVAAAPMTIPSATAQPTAPPPAPMAGSNAIVAENALPGNPESQWGMTAYDANLEGFPTDISTNKSGIVRFKVNTNATQYHIEIYRLGYYNGMGARLVDTVQPSVALPQAQPAPLTDPATGLVDAGNWAESASWTVPTTATSGVYIGRLVRDDGVAGASNMYFVVRNDAGQSNLLFQTSDTTWHAYNTWGGNTFYSGSPAGRAYKLSYNRPFGDPWNSFNTPLFDSEYPMIRWLERNGYDVSYASGVDTDRFGSNLLQHKAFLSVGHDEYWSGRQRANVEAARNAGVNLAFFSGNEDYWKTRWEPSIDGSATPYRTLVCYKETWANEPIDPQDPPTWTGTWRDPRFSPPADGGRPENRTEGTLFQVDSTRLDTVSVPADDGKMRFWRNTSINNQAPGATATLTPYTLGYEWDEAPDNGFRPAGEINLSSTTLTVPTYLLDYGNTTGLGVATHHTTLYRDQNSGALVFSAGATRWSWGLDDQHINEPSTPDPNMQQVTVNILADMGAQPATLQSGLVPASASTDTTPPVSTITAPAGGTTVQSGSTVTISGTANDTGGGVVGGVEVSVDGGTSWHPAIGRESWSYRWTAQTPGTATLLSRAVDDSGNLGSPGPGTTVTVQRPTTGPWSIWSNEATPAIVTVDDSNPVELGVKFTADTAGYITGLRFYKGPQNTGTHVVSLWSNTGQQLATATATNETASGWQTVNLPTPVAITANTLYVASYHTNGFYSADTNYFAYFGVDNSPLHAPSNLAVGGNGVYLYSTAGGFPNSTFNASNYWVDVAFQAQAQATVSIWSASDTPGIASVADPNAVELGVKFRASVAGTILGIRFYKGPQNTGTHVAHLWSATGGTPLATATFSNETASGWQQVTFAPPVTIQANTTYVASYFAPNGNYAFDQNYFVNARTNGPLTALADGTDGGNGVYLYSMAGGFPNSTFNASNYWVDVIFQEQPMA